ncbi:hypothetical protein RUM43_013491 [Polyplax serrata]|uniref:Uncharacterized protein n=1 Tax=Polyplax serrata TaxID=468196 RepID=A0AAN8NY04_POLSC
MTKKEAEEKMMARNKKNYTKKDFLSPNGCGFLGSKRKEEELELSCAPAESSVEFMNFNEPVGARDEEKVSKVLVRTQHPETGPPLYSPGLFPLRHQDLVPAEETNTKGPFTPVVFHTDHHRINFISMEMGRFYRVAPTSWLLQDPGLGLFLLDKFTGSNGTLSPISSFPTLLTKWVLTIL